MSGGGSNCGAMWTCLRPAGRRRPPNAPGGGLRAAPGPENGPKVRSSRPKMTGSRSGQKLAKSLEYLMVHRPRADRAPFAACAAPSRGDHAVRAGAGGDRGRGRGVDSALGAAVVLGWIGARPRRPPAAAITAVSPSRGISVLWAATDDFNPWPQTGIPLAYFTPDNARLSCAS